jgi:hypothetical protein
MRFATMRVLNLCLLFALGVGLALAPGGAFAGGAMAISSGSAMNPLGAGSSERPILSARFSADGKTVAFTASQPADSLWAVGSDGSGLQRVGSNSGFWALSDNGLYALTDGGHRVIPIRGGQQHAVKFRDGWVAPIISADGSVFAPDRTGITWIHPSGTRTRVRTSPARIRLTLEGSQTDWVIRDWFGREGPLAFCGQLKPKGSIAFGLLNEKFGTMTIRDTHIQTLFLTTCLVTSQGTVGTVLQKTQNGGFDGGFEFVTYSPIHGIHRWKVHEYADEPATFSPSGRFGAVIPSRSVISKGITLPHHELEIYDVYGGGFKNIAPPGGTTATYWAQPTWLDDRTVAVVTKQNGHLRGVQFIGVTGRSTFVELPAALRFPIQSQRVSMVATPDGSHMILRFDRAVRDDWVSVTPGGKVVPLTNDTVRLGSDSDSAGPIFAGSRAWMIGSDGDLHWTEAKGFGASPLSYGP